MHRQSTQRGFILLPVVLAIALIATIAFLLTTESAIDGAMTEDSAAAIEVEQVVRAGLAHATWGAQNSGCAGDMTMTTVPFGQAGSDNYTATVTTPGGGTTAYSNLASDQDAWFRSDDITNNNGGTASAHHLRRESGNLEYAVVRFDLSSLPAGAQVNSAVARFYVDGGKGHPEGPVTVHRATADWTETDATWETLGDRFDSAVLDTIPAQPDAGDDWVTINLTAQVQAWVNGGEPNYGIMLIPTGEGTHAEYISREGSANEQPRLDVIVGNGAATPATITVTGTLAGNPSPASDITRILTRTSVPTYQPAATVTYTLGIDTGRDAMLDSSFSTRNHGNGYSGISTNPFQKRRTLLHFDLSGIPPGAAIQSARLELFQQSASALLFDPTVTLHRVTRDWVEGTKNGGGIADGATWDTWDGVNAWTTPGGDYDPTVLARAPITTTTQEWLSWDITDLAAGWLAGRFENHGVLLKGTGGQWTEFTPKEAQSSYLDMRPRLNITYACECGSPCMAPQGTGNVLMVVDDNVLSATDTLKKAQLESWGYIVTSQDDNTSQSGFNSQISGSDVVFISESVDPGTLAGKLATAPIGVVSEEGLLNDDLGLSNNAGVTVGSSITITDTSHYITAPFAAGALDIYDAEMEQLVIFNGPAPDLQTLADVGSNSALVTLEAGAVLKGGATASGRRVMLPFGRDANKNWDYINANGLLILHRALQWGMNADGGIPPKNLLFVSAGSTPTAQEQLRIDLIESWGYSVNLIADDDNQANFDIAIAANDVAYVPVTVDGAVLGTKLLAATIGVVIEEWATGFGIATDYQFKDRDEIDIIDNTHYITSPFSTGLLTYLTSLQPVTKINSGLAPDLITLGMMFNTGTQWKEGLAVIETGGTLSGGGTAAGRRVQLPWGDAGFDIAALNDAGRTIMQRSIEWAKGTATSSVPIAHWKLDETSGIDAVDSAGGHDGTLTNDPTWGAGQVGGSLGFDGSNDYVDVPYDAALSLTQEMTFTAWIKATSFGSGYQAILSTDVPGNGASNYWFGTRLGEVVFGFWADSAFRTVQSTGLNLLPDTWYHLAASFDNATDQVLLYLDGAQVQAGSITFEPTPETANIWIGRSVDGEYWPGKLDEVRIYDQVLNATEIADLAAESDNTELNVLLAVGDATTLASKDAGRKALMESWGYTVNVIDDGESQATFDTAVAANDVAFVTSSVGGGTLANKLTGAAIPIVNEFPGKLDNFGFSSVTTDTFSADSFSKSDGSHYISSPYGGGSISLLTSFMAMSKPSGTLAPDLQVVAELATAEFGLVALDAGGTRWDGNPAAARRVFLPYGDALTSEITTEGQDLMKRSIEWALGGGGGGGGGGSPLAAPVFEEFTEGYKPAPGGESVSIPKPGGTAAGDLLIAAVATDGDTVSTLSPSAAWNLTQLDVGSGSGVVTLGIWWKIADGTEPENLSYSWTGSEHAYSWIMRFTGHDPGSPIATASTSTGSSRDPLSNNLITGTNDNLILRLGGFDDDDITLDAPGLPGHTVITMDRSGTGVQNTVSGGAGYVIQTTAGDTGTSTFNLTAREEYRTVTIAIRPAP